MGIDIPSYILGKGSGGSKPSSGIWVPEAIELCEFQLPLKGETYNLVISKNSYPNEYEILDKLAQAISGTYFSDSELDFSEYMLDTSSSRLINSPLKTPAFQVNASNVKRPFNIMHRTTRYGSNSNMLCYMFPYHAPYITGITPYPHKPQDGSTSGACSIDFAYAMDNSSVIIYKGHIDINDPHGSYPRVSLLLQNPYDGSDSNVIPSNVPVYLSLYAHIWHRIKDRS